MSSTAACRPAPKVRDLRFDTVRGALLLIMALSHVDSDLRIFIDQPFGFVSTAEGFIFLSGILTGRIDRKRADQPAELWSRARKRAWRIYVWHALALTGVWLLTQAWVHFDGSTPWELPFLFHHTPLTGLVAGLTLLYQPGLLDILPMYAGMALLTPLIVRAHRAGYGLHLWIASGVIWGLDQCLLPPHLFERGVINTGAFHFLSWQWIFVSGVLIGAERRLNRHPSRLARPQLLALGIAGGLFLALLRWHLVPAWWDDVELNRLTVKTPLALLRLVNFGLLAWLLGLVASVRPAWFNYRPLALLGEHSLPVFVVSIWCACLTLCFPESGWSPVGRWLETALVIVGMAATAFACEYLRKRSAPPP